MSEEKKEKPDWLSDFQNNQATSSKQIFSEGENNKVTLDLYDPVVTYISPRYGRRSITGAKSVENSPKKGCSSESQSVTARSNSARPALLNINISPNETGIYGDQNAENFAPALQLLQNDLENFSFDDLLDSFKVPSSSVIGHPVKSKTVLEDSISSLTPFNIKKRGRLNPSRKDELPKELGNDKGKKERYKKHVNGKNPKREESYLKHEKSKQVEENWRETKVKNNGLLNKVDVSKSDANGFIIPELPQGKNLVFNIKTTWGDKHYLGLSGIEIFNSKGRKVQVKSIKADPSDINVLSEYSNDPRIVENLIDNVCLTQDDTHMWLVPFTPNSPHLIFIEFNEIEELAMLRVWNYNKSRIHCFRGAKDVEIKLDNKFIFIGEIARASGEILSTLNCLGDTILFTTDEDILESVAENDDYFTYSILNTLEEDQTKQEELRPLTGGNKEKEPFTYPEIKARFSEEDLYEYHYQENQKSISDPKNRKLETPEIPDTKFSYSFEEARGLQNFRYLDCGDVKQESSSEKVKSTEVLLNTSKEDLGAQKSGVLTSEMKSTYMLENDPAGVNSEFPDKNFTLYIPSASFLASDSAYETLSMPTGYIFTIQILSTWGDLYYVGLNGIQMYDENNMEIKIHPQDITADPESVNVLDEIDNDPRTADKLIDGVNESADGCHMWLAPVLPLTINRIHFTFQNPITLSSIKLWNYAKTPSRGVREFGILVDGLLIYNGELDQATVATDGTSPSVPCKTVNFSDENRVQSSKQFFRPREETFNRSFQTADQSQRPLTTMTSRS